MYQKYTIRFTTVIAKYTKYSFRPRFRILFKGKIPMPIRMGTVRWKSSNNEYLDFETVLTIILEQFKQNTGAYDNMIRHGASYTISEKKMVES